MKLIRFGTLVMISQNHDANGFNWFIGVRYSMIAALSLFESMPNARNSGQNKAPDQVMDQLAWSSSDFADTLFRFDVRTDPGVNLKL